MRRRTTSSNKNHKFWFFFLSPLTDGAQQRSDHLLLFCHSKNISRTANVPFHFIFFASFRFDSVRFTGAQPDDPRTAYERTQLDVVRRQISLEMIFVRAERTCWTSINRYDVCVCVRVCHRMLD